MVVFAREACDMSRHDRVHVRWKKCPTNHKKCVSKLFSERSQLDRYFIVLEPQGYSRYSYKCGLVSFVLVSLSLCFNDVKIKGLKGHSELAWGSL